MKKLFLLGCMTAMWLVSAAQDKSKVDILKLPEQKKIQWTVDAGVSFNGAAGPNVETCEAKWRNSKYDGSFCSMIGFDLGGGFDLSYGKSPWYGGLYLHFGSAGYKTEESKSSNDSYNSPLGGVSVNRSRTKKTNTLDMYSLRLSPTFVGYKYKINESMMVSAHAGGYFSYYLFGKQKYDECSYSYSSYKGDTNEKNSHKKSETKISDVENMNSFDAGLDVGAAFHYGHFKVGFSWMRGFIPIYKGGSEITKIGKEERKVGNLYESDFRISIGYTF